MNRDRTYTHLLPAQAAQANLADRSLTPDVRDDLGALRAIVEGTACGTGEEFFRSLVRHLARAISVPYAVVAEFADVNTRVRSLAFWARDRIVDNFEYDFAGTPCEAVLRGGFTHIPTVVKERF